MNKNLKNNLDKGWDICNDVIREFMISQLTHELENYLLLLLSSIGILLSLFFPF